jgi:hypothetical protein
MMKVHKVKGEGRQSQLHFVILHNITVKIMCTSKTQSYTTRTQVYVYNNVYIKNTVLHNTYTSIRIQ